MTITVRFSEPIPQMASRQKRVEEKCKYNFIIYIYIYIITFSFHLFPQLYTLRNFKL